MLKLALVQLNPIVGDLEGNTAQIIRYIHEAKSAGVDLVVFPELSITGYPPLDVLNFDDFILRCEQSIQKIGAQSAGISVIVGAPVKNTGNSGKALYNAAVYLENGEVVKHIHKTLLPTYDVFDECRWFEPNHIFELITCKGHQLAVTICEDLWNIGPVQKYHISPMEQLKVLAPEMIINIAASPFSLGHPELRKSVLLANVQAYKIPLVYVNQCGAQTELVFDGNSQVLQPNESSYLLPSFSETMACFEYNGVVLRPVDSSLLPENKMPLEPEVAQIERALVTGIRDYFQKSGFKKAILGLSGGVDSALVTVLAVKALGRENVYPVLMPSRYSSDHSVSDSIQLITNLGITNYGTVPIEEVYQAVTHSLQPAFLGKGADLTEENIQSRIRGLFLMALSNKHGYILLNTSNKSELAVGYGTLYGDMCGGLSVIGDVYKTLVYQICEWINREHEIIPRNILEKAPSAELRPDQKDTDSLPDYEVLDAIVKGYCEHNQSASSLVAAGFEEITVKRVLHLVNSNEYKRKQTPPILRITGRSFGAGRIMPIVSRLK